MNTVDDLLILCRRIGQAVKQETVSPLPQSESITALTKAHHLEALVGALTEDAALAAEGRQAVFYQMKRDVLADTVSRQLSKRGVRHITLKGRCLAVFYPDTLVRTSADVDWYVNEKDMKTATAVLTENGFSCDYAREDGAGFLKAPCHSIELHTTMDGFTDKQQQSLFSMTAHAVCAEEERYVLTNDDLAAYTLFHLYKHFVKAGVGVKMLLDIYVLDRHGLWERETVQNILKDLGINRFCDAVRSLCHVMFDGEAPTAEQEELLAFVLESGAYGTNGIELTLERINSNITQKSRRKRFFEDHGLDRRAMETRYPVLKRSILLYPFLLVHRAVKGVIFKRTVLKNAVKREKALSSVNTDRITRVLRIAGIL